MIHIFRTLITVVAAVVFTVAIPMSHIGTAVSMSDTMGTMTRHDLTLAGCALVCNNPVSREGDYLVPQDGEIDDDDTSPIPYYVALRHVISVKKLGSMPDKFLYKPPPKVPLYIAFVQLRP